MKIQKVFYKVNTSCFRKANIDVETLKSKEVLKRKKQYENFKLLLDKNKSIKNIKERLSYKQIEKIIGISKATFYNIKKEVKTKGSTYWQILEIDSRNGTKNRKPRNFRKSQINEETKQVILRIRLENPTYSERKIEVILLRDFNIKLSHRTIGKILKQLNQKGLISLKGNKLNKKLKPNELNQTKPRDFNKGYAKKWEYKKHCISNSRLKIKTEPGELIQIDHLKINKNDKRFIEISAIDPTTRIKSSYCYPSATSKNARDFLLNKLIKEFPFSIKSIQVDGGGEFRKHFEAACKQLKIELFVLPPYSPKYNGRIERANRTDREEFWNNKRLTDSCINIGDFNEKLQEFNEKYNNFRPHETIDFKTPMEYYLELENMRNCLRCVVG